MGNIVYGTAQITNIGIKYILLKNITLLKPTSRPINIDHTWIHRESSHMIDICLGELIYFEGYVISYTKECKKKNKKHKLHDYGFKILNWWHDSNP
ncbi:MAG: hypothetical protein ACTSXF_03885 [Promethearchaeota archaeon]